MGVIRLRTIESTTIGSGNGNAKKIRIVTGTTPSGIALKNRVDPSARHQEYFLASLRK